MIQIWAANDMLDESDRPKIAAWTMEAIQALEVEQGRAWLITEADFASPLADGGGAIPCWKEAKSPTRRSGWAVIVYGKWLNDTEGGHARYWTRQPTDQQRRAMPW